MDGRTWFERALARAEAEARDQVAAELGRVAGEQQGARFNSAP